ncbi:MAG: phosphatidylglycerophosphatase A [Candidatus Omnitrophota bacterium]
MYNFFLKFITTVFFIGYLPLAPGTFGSAAGLFIYVFFKENPFFSASVCFLITILGFLLAGKAAKLFARRDPPEIVIDELSGILVSFLGIPVEDKLTLLIGFILFRAFDVIKIYPANRLDRLRGGVGIMGDDIIAGIYTNIILRIIFLLK